MNELKFNSQVCTTKEQSQRLLELGLKPETADMYYTEGSEDGAGNIEYHLNIRTKRDNRLFPDYIPAWSLHRLLCLYGQDYTIKELYNNAEECYGMLISAIEIAIENDEFNKEYLKQ